MADTDARAGATTGSEPQGQERPIAHDDIMRRILEYQRRLREGAPPSEAAKAVAESDPSALGAGSSGEATITAMREEPVVDLTRAEAELSARTAETEARTAETGARTAETGARTAETEAAVGQTPVSPAEAVAPGAAETEVEAPTVAEPTSTVWAPPVPDPALSARVERLEQTMEQIADQVSDLRQRFQDLAIAADERLAELERTLARARER